MGVFGKMIIYECDECKKQTSDKEKISLFEFKFLGGESWTCCLCNECKQKEKNKSKEDKK
jgi:hypothetical protein